MKHYTRRGATPISKSEMEKQKILKSLKRIRREKKRLREIKYQTRSKMAAPSTYAFVTVLSRPGTNRGAAGMVYRTAPCQLYGINFEGGEAGR